MVAVLKLIFRQKANTFCVENGKQFEIEAEGNRQDGVEVRARSVKSLSKNNSSLQSNSSFARFSAKSTLLDLI